MARLDCSELSLKISDWAMSIGAETGAKDIDSVVKEMQKTIPTMTREMVVDSIVEATQGKAQETDELADDLNRIKREARIDKNTRNRITELQKYLDEGEAPPKSKRRVKTASDALKELRAIRDGLQKQVAQSDPVRQARLIEQIRKLEDKIERGDIQPKQKKIETKIGSDIERLEFERDQLRSDIKRRLNELKPRTIWENIAEPFNVARSLITTLDLSAVLRQGGFFALGRPVQSAQAFKSMMTALKSEQGLRKIHQEIDRNPWRALAQRAKLFIAPTDGTYKLSAMEERFQSKWAEKLPGVRASERAYVTFLNKQRIDMFATFMETLTKNGEPTLQEAQIMANFVNMATGRGSLGALENAAVPLNTLFFAPRYVASRFQLLLGAPLFKGTARTRKLIAGEYARYMIGLGALYSLAELLSEVFGKEIDIEHNPTSSDFGKIRLGNTRIDPLSGISQVSVFLSRLITGEIKSSNSGMTVPISEYRGGQFGTITKFLRTKLSPMFGTAINILPLMGKLKRGEVKLDKSFFTSVIGKDVVGQPVTPWSTFVSLIMPLSLREIKDSIQEQGLATGTAVSLAAILGMGVQTYGVALKKTSDKELIDLLRKNTYKRNTTVIRGGKMVNGKRVGGQKVRVRAGQAHKDKEAMVESIRKELLRRQNKPKKPKQQDEMKNLLDKLNLNKVSKVIGDNNG
jgi:hypothetical protein